MSVVNARTTFDGVLDALVVPGYSRIGYAIRSRAWSALDDSPLLDRTVVVTGHTSGIGFAAACMLRRLGANLVVIGRDAARSEDAANRIRVSSGPGTVEVLVADIGQPNDVRNVSDVLLRKFSRIDALVHNAGALLKTRSRNLVGDDTTLAVHVYGPHLMTSLLLPALQRAEGRVITVSSGGMYAMRLPKLTDDRGLELSDDQYDGTKQYAIAKRAQVTLNEMWSRRPDATGVTFHAMHPGWVDTPGVATSIPLFRAVTKPILRSAEQGADTIAWLCAEDSRALGSGGFWCDRARRPIHRLPATKRADTAARREALWNVVERRARGGRDGAAGHLR